MTNIKNPKKPLEYNCKECLFKCSNKKDYSRHILTAKHKILTNPNEKTPKNAKPYMCPCGKVYKHSSSLCSHKKTCVFLKEIATLLSVLLVCTLCLKFEGHININPSSGGTNHTELL